VVKFILHGNRLDDTEHYHRWTKRTMAVILRRNKVVHFLLKSYIAHKHEQHSKHQTLLDSISAATSTIHVFLHQHTSYC